MASKRNRPQSWDGLKAELASRALEKRPGRLRPCENMDRQKAGKKQPRHPRRGFKAPASHSPRNGEKWIRTITASITFDVQHLFALEMPALGAHHMGPDQSAAIVAGHQVGRLEGEVAASLVALPGRGSLLGYRHGSLHFFKPFLQIKEIILNQLKPFRKPWVALPLQWVGMGGGDLSSSPWRGRCKKRCFTGFSRIGGRHCFECEFIFRSGENSQHAKCLFKVEISILSMLEV